MWVLFIIVVTSTGFQVRDLDQTTTMNECFELREQRKIQVQVEAPHLKHYQLVCVERPLGKNDA